MEVFSDKFGCKIWFTVSNNILYIDLQDITEQSEYERSASVSGLVELCNILKCDVSKLQKVLVAKFGGKVNSFDLLTDFLTENRIQYGHYSGVR